MLSELVSSGRKIDGMYIEYKNGTSPAEPDVAVDRSRSYFDALAAPYGYIRITNIKPPEFRSITDVYAGNEVVFTGDSAGAEVYGPGLIDNSSWLFSVSLISVVDAMDRTKDVIYNTVSFRYGGYYIPVMKRPNMAVGAVARIRFINEDDIPHKLMSEDIFHITTVDMPRTFEYVGALGTYASLYINGSLIRIANVGGNLWWNNGGTGAYRFTYPGETISRTVGGLTLSITWKGFGSLLFSLSVWQ